MGVPRINSDIAAKPENWLVHGAALETRRRRAGADAQRGFDYQRAFAVWQIAELLKDSSEIAGVRYEGAQDVDLLFTDGQVAFVQLKDEPGETYAVARIAPILIGFALDLHDCDENPRARFELIIHATPGAAALQRLAERATTSGDRAVYLRELRGVAQLAALDPGKLERILHAVLERITVRRGMARLGGQSGEPIFSLLAEKALRDARVAEEHIEGLLVQIERSLKGRRITSKAEVLSWAHAARRLPHRIVMAPVLPRYFQPRHGLIDHLRDRLLTDHRVAITGLGGAGKTMLAQALGRDADVTNRYPDGVLWASFGQNPDIPAHLRALLRTLNRPVDAAGDEATLHAELNAALAGRTFLLVLDDLWDMTIGTSFLPPEGCGLIVTSRQPRIARSLSMDGVEVGGLDAEEAIALIEQSTGPIAEGDRAAAERFADRVSRLPFAVRLGAQLVADGRSFDRLVQDLDAEGLRLAALDIDQGEEQIPGDERRREKSLEACLALSVAALGLELRTCFFRLAVLPEDAEVDPELAAAIFALDDPIVARDRLFDLWARGLMAQSGPTYSATFRAHDLVLDYARAAFGTRRAMLAATPPALPATLPALHGQLIDRSRNQSPTGRWADCWPDFYFDDHLGAHLIAAERVGDLARVLRETADGQATWLARQRRHQNTSGFLQFVRDCLAQGIIALLAQPANPDLTALADMTTATIAGASATGRAANIPVGLLAAMVRAGEQTFDDALTQAGLCHYAQRAHHLLDLLPLAPANARPGMLANLIAELVRTPIPLMGDREILDLLLPQLSDPEIAIAEAAARISPEVESEFLWGLARSASTERIADIIAYCKESDEPDIRHTLLLLAADGLGGFEASVELVQAALSSRRNHVKFAAFIALPPAELVRHMTNANVVNHVIESWERHPARVSPAVVTAIWRVIDGLEPDQAALGAWMSARLMAASVPSDAARIAACEAGLAAMDDSDWRKADGLGWLLQAAPAGLRSALAERFVTAASGQGFRDLGAKRMKQIAAALPEEHFEVLARVYGSALPARRAMVLAALLEHAPEKMWSSLAEEICREAQRSGQIGDIYAAADRIPGELRKSLWQAIDQVRPTPELVHAAAALSEKLAPELKAWFARSWAYLRPYERIRAAAGHADIAALYGGKQDILMDLAQSTGLLSRNGEMLPLNAFDAADGKRLIAGHTAEDCRSFLDSNPDVAAQVADYHIASLLDWFGAGLSRDELGTLWERVRNMAPDNRATILGRIAQFLDDKTTIGEAVTALLENRSPASAAIWFARYGHLTRPEDRARLHALRAPDMPNREAAMLEVALYPYLDGKARAGIEPVFVRRRGLFPAFVASLDRSLYPATMTAIFDQCLSDFAQARQGPGSQGWLSDAKQLLDLPPECLPALYSAGIPDRMHAILLSAAILATTTGMDVEKLCKVITRVAPLLAGSLTQDERDILAATMVASARAHSY